MTRAALLALADRVEALTGPCRETDAEVHHAILQGIGTGLYGTQPSYTASLDAAMTLVPEGHTWSADLNLGKKAFAWCYDDKMLSGRPCKAATPALALTAAALRARAMMEIE